MDKNTKLLEIQNMARVTDVLKHEVFTSQIKSLEELEKDRIFCRHGMDHLLAVARLAYIFSLERSYELNKDLIYATALLHDIGRSRQYIDGTPHAIGGIEMARQVLEESGFSADEVELALNAIREHSDETPTDRASELSIALYDADKQSRDCFNCNAEGICKWDLDMKNMTVIW